MKKTTPKEEIDRLIQRYVPEGVSVVWRTDGDWRPAHAIRCKRTGKLKMLSPYPDSPFKALVFLHECAHFANGDCRVNVLSHVEEFGAERTAMEWWRHEGYRVPQEYLKEAKRYVRECIAYDRERGHAIKPHIARWARK